MPNPEGLYGYAALRLDGETISLGVGAVEVQCRMAVGGRMVEPVPPYSPGGLVTA
jgi:hypothetical protein